MMTETGKVMQKNRLPIGFFDSGIGGLSVLKHAMRELPEEKFIYYGDTLHAPYGNKSEEEIKELSMACCKFLCDKGVKAIVMACNTATSVSVRQMREQYRLPVISIEPAIKPAFEARKQGKILVMATPATIAQQRYRDLVDRLQCGHAVINMPCGGLVEILEQGDFEDPRIEVYLREKFATLKDTCIDGIVMGCTHYSFIARKIQRLAEDYFTGEKVVYDGMYGTVRQLGRVLQAEGLVTDQPGQTLSLYSSMEHSVEIFAQILAQRA